MRKHRTLSLPALLMLSLLLSACATAAPPMLQKGETEETNDPFEPWNRQVYENNYFFDRLLVRPLAELYRVTVPPGIRDRIANILKNMREPVILINDVLQGDFDKAGITIERFGINTTIGIGGMWDFAGEWGMYQQTGDFGQTLAVWGMDEGPYVMLPVYGPSNVRDAVGRGVDIILSPWQYFTLMDSMTTFIRYEGFYFGADTLVRREKNIETIDSIRSGSLDPYYQLRSAYRQYRKQQLGLEPSHMPAFEAEQKNKKNK